MVSKDVLPANFLFSCNVPELGINTAKLILKHFKDLDDFLNNWDTPTFVKDGKLAPGLSGYYEIEVDPTGSDVAIDYTITIGSFIVDGEEVDNLYISNVKI